MEPEAQRPAGALLRLLGGKHVRPRRFRRRLAADLSSVLALLDQGAIAPQVAARFPLPEAGKAMQLAESRMRGKVVLVP